VPIGSFLNTVEAYDPATKTWSTLAPLQTPRLGLAAATGRDGRIYVMGGQSAPQPPGPFLVTPSVEAYDPAMNTWSAVAPMPTARVNLAATTGPDGRIYAIGGCTCGLPGNQTLPTVEVYDPSTNRWSTAAPMPTPRADLAATTGPDGRIYAIGGCSPCGFSGRVLSTVEVYDPSTNSWSTGVPMPTPRIGLATATGSDGRIYAAGGCSVCDGGRAFVPVNTVEAYTPATAPIVTPTPRVVAVPLVSRVPGQPGPATASLTVSFSSTLPGQGEVYFGSGPGCLGLVEVATRDLTPGTTTHTVVVLGNDLPGTVGDNGIIPGVTYWFEVITVTRSGVEVDSNTGRCYSVTVPT
jgi:N-acetylneuraminic acid mutarotase